MNIPDGIIMAFQIIGGFILLYFGGDWLVNGGVALARRFRISPLVIGMTIVAFGTSAPELLVSMTSAIKGSAGIAMGNVLGSNIANIGLILGLTAILCPIPTRNRMISANGLIMIAASFMLLAFSMNGEVSVIEGAILFICIVLFTVISIRKGRIQENASEQSVESGSSDKVISAPAALLLVMLSCAMLAFGADFMVDGATSLAKTIGVSDKVIGLTVVALGTSLPELAASLAAAIKKEMDISIGNIIGSNIFNILCVLGISTTIRPITFDFTHYITDFVIMLTFSIGLLVLIQPWKTQGRLGRISGLFLFGSYVIYVWFLF